MSSSSAQPDGAKSAGAIGRPGGEHHRDVWGRVVATSAHPEPMDSLALRLGAFLVFITCSSEPAKPPAKPPSRSDTELRTSSFAQTAAAPTALRTNSGSTCPTTTDKSSAQQCPRIWEPLRTGAVADVPLAMRCALADELAYAVVDAISVSRTRWVSVEADTLQLEILVGESSGGARRLIAETESCPQAQAIRIYHGPETRSTVDVDIRGPNGGASGPDIALRLADTKADPCACDATFTWDLGVNLATMWPPEQELAAELAPRLTVLVASTSTGDFTIARTSLELPPAVEVREHPLGLCAGMWDDLRAGRAKAVPLAQRCHLATTLAAAAIDTIVRMRTRWLQIDADEVDLMVLIGPEPRSDSALITAEESCPKAQVSRLLDSPARSQTLGIRIRGSSATHEPPALVLHLSDLNQQESSCSAIFAWSLGDRMRVPRPSETWTHGAIRGGGSWRVRPPTGPVRTGFSAPDIVLEVGQSTVGELLVLRKALAVREVRGAISSSP